MINIIQLTDLYNNKSIFLNIDNIVSFYHLPKKGTKITLTNGHIDVVENTSTIVKLCKED